MWRNKNVKHKDKTLGATQRLAEGLARAIIRHLSHTVYLKGVQLILAACSAVEACAYLVSIWVLDDAARASTMSSLKMASVLRDNHIAMIFTYRKVTGM